MKSLTTSIEGFFPSPKVQKKIQSKTTCLSDFWEPNHSESPAQCIERKIVCFLVYSPPISGGKTHSRPLEHNFGVPPELQLWEGVTCKFLAWEVTCNQNLPIIHVSVLKSYKKCHAWAFAEYFEKICLHKCMFFENVSKFSKMIKKLSQKSVLNLPETIWFVFLMGRKLLREESHANFRPGKAHADLKWKQK